MPKQIMLKSLPNKNIVPISEAAEILGVSLDTIRRWDKEGVLHSQRAADNTRYFSLEELEKVKFSKPLSISQAAQKLKISQSTLRRLEKKGLITPKRIANGERVYTKASLEKFLHSEYFLRQREVEKKILEPLLETKQEERGTVLSQNKEYIEKLLNFRRMFYFTGLFLVTVFVLLVILFTILFMLFPEDTARFFGYYQGKNASKLAGLVLGEKYPEDSVVKGTVIGKVLKPFGRISLGLVSKINPQVYEKIVPKNPIEDVNDIMTINENGAIEPYFNFTVPDTSYIQIPDKGLIANLNADYIRGKVPGTNEGNLVAYGKNNTIPGLSISSSQIRGGIGGGQLSDDAVTSEKIDDGTIVTIDLADGSITSAKIADGTIANADVSDNAISSLKISDGTIVNADISDSAAIKDSKLAQITVGDKVAGSAVQLNSSGGIVNSAGLSLSRSCSNNQVLRWNLSSTVWDCATVSSSGGSITVEEGDSTVSSSATNLDFLAADFTVSESPSGEANVSIDYTNSNIARKNQSETVSSGWTFSSGLTVSSLNTAGAVVYTNSSGGLNITAQGTSGQCLTSASSAAPTWQNCALGSTTNWWDQTSGALYPINQTLDLLIGNTATTSAKFAVLNVNSGTPIASVSAQNAAGNAVYIDSTGAIQTTVRGTLTLGSSTTGNIVIDAGSNVTQLADNTIQLTGSAPIVSASTTNAAVQLNANGTGTLTLNSGATGNIQFFSSSNTLSSGGILTIASNLVLSNSSATTQFGGIAYTWPSSQTANYALTTNGSGTLSWTDLSTSTSNFWRQTSGALYPANTTVDLLIGGTATTSAKFAFINVLAGTPTASVSAGTAGGAVLTATGTLATTQKQTLTLADTNTGNINIGTDSTARTINIGNGGAAETITLGSTNTTSSVTINKGATGNITLPAFTNNGGVLLTDTSGNLAQTLVGSSGQCLTSIGGGTPTFRNCALGDTTNWWTQTNGALYPINSTLDLLVGSTSSSSAKFAVLNINSGTPTASISAGTAGGASLTATGVLATTAKQTLTLGDSNTGEVQLTPGGTLALTARGANLIGAGTLTGLTGLTSSGTITFSAFTSNGGPLYTNGSGVLAQTTAGTTTQVLHGGTTPSFSAVNLAADVSGILPTANGGSWWNSSSGALYPGNTTLDVLIGSTATSSAKFGFINVAGGTPTASISANSGNNATTLSGTGILGTTNAQTLTIGNSSTGNIVIDSGSNVLSLADNTISLTGSGPVLNAPAGALSINTTNNQAITTGSGLTTLGGSLTVNGTTFTVGNGSNVTVTTTSNGNLTFTSAGSGNTTVTSDGDTGLLVGTSSNTQAPLSVSGGIGSNAAFILNQTNSGDILAASASGTTKFTITNAGTATMSGNLVLDSAGSLQTTKAQTLTIGGSSTGDINISLAGSSKLRIGGTAGATGNPCATTGATNGIVTTCTASDARLKGNINPITNVLDKLKSLRGVSFNYNEIAHQKFVGTPDGLQFGFLAQEIETVFPNLVQKTGVDDYLTVNYTELIPVLLQGIKELDDKVNPTVVDENGKLKDGLAGTSLLLARSDPALAQQLVQETASKPGVLGAQASESIDLSEFVRMTSDGSLKIDRPVDFFSQVIFQGEVKFEGRPTFNKDTGGMAVVKKDSRQVEVKFEREYAQKPVVTASIVLDDSEESGIMNQESRGLIENAVFSNDIRYLVTRRTTKGFVVKLNKPAIFNIPFSWIAIAVQDAKTSESKAHDSSDTSDSPSASESSDLLRSLTPTAEPTSVPMPTVDALATPKSSTSGEKTE